MAKPQAVLYRILGNDLPPRYSPGQTLANLRFILENEPELPGLEKRWLLNRIVCPDTLAALQATIREAGQRFDVIPFEEDVYRQIWTDLGDTPPECHPWSEAYQQLPPLMQLRIGDYISRFKNQYLMNNNGARNRAIELGLADAEWALPWDGGCFLPEWSWDQMQVAMADTQCHYLCVPMHRLTHNNARPKAQERDDVSWDEPQIAFSVHSKLHFDENLRYGSMPKALLLRRIGLPGPWHQWDQGWLPWEQPQQDLAPDAGLVELTGLVLRLSGEKQDVRHSDRDSLWPLRFGGIFKFIRILDRRLMAEQLQRHQTCRPDLEAVDAMRDAPAVLSVGKPAPHAWLDLPCLTIYQLALSYCYSGDRISLQQVQALIKDWILDPDTALNPASLPLSSVSQMEGVVLLHYALLLLRQSGAFTAEQLNSLRTWWEHLLSWLLSGSEEFLREHPCEDLSASYHLVLLAVASELADASICCQVLDNLPALTGRGLAVNSVTLLWLKHLCRSLGRDVAF